MLEQAGINLKGLNVDKLKAEYQELMKQKSELTSTYKDCEKEVRELKRKQENLNQYLGRTQPDPAQDQQGKKIEVRWHPYPKPLAKSARLVYNQIRKPKDIGVSNGCTIGNL